MAAKPKGTTILKTYSIDELLDLIREKARLYADEKISGIRTQLQGLALGFGIEKKMRAPGKKRGRPKLAVKKSAVAKTKPATKTKPVSKSKPGKRTKSVLPLNKNIVAVLSSKPMKIDDILAAVIDNGWKTASKAPKRLLQIELGKLIKKKAIKKAGRGMYKAN